MRNDIPQGHQLQITSWENDADSYKTLYVSGLAPNDVKFYLELLKPFASRNGGGLYGNGPVDSAELTMHLMSVFAKHRLGLSDSVRVKYENEINEDTAYEFITELLDTPDNEYYACEGNFCRVFSSARVVYFPRAGKDVTADFV